MGPELLSDLEKNASSRLKQNHVKTILKKKKNRYIYDTKKESRFLFFI